MHGIKRFSSIGFILLATVLSSCTATYQLDEEGNPIIPPEDRVITVPDPKATGKARAYQSIYCNMFPNTRRIILRFIRAMDPEWKSVCEIMLEEEAEQEAAEERTAAEGLQ